jgi:hypothetical protein
MAFRIGNPFARLTAALRQGVTSRPVQNVATQAQQTLRQAKNALATGQVPQRWRDGFQQLTGDARIGGMVQATVESLQQATGRRPTPEQPELMKGHRDASSYQQVEGQLFVNGVSREDIRQGAAGNCYFLASLSALAESHPEAIQNAIRQNGDGTYTVTFHLPPGFEQLRALGPAGGLMQESAVDAMARLGVSTGGRKVEVTVDGTLPTSEKGALYSKTPEGELWVPIMEKAYAKLWGGYGAVGNGGNMATAMRLLTGGDVDTRMLGTNFVENMLSVKYRAREVTPQKVDQVYADIQAATAAGKFLAASTYVNNSVDRQDGIVYGHVYSMHGVSEEGGQKYVHLRNPWGRHEPGNDGANDGFFKMPMEQFLRQFARYDIGSVPGATSAPGVA